MIQEDTRLGLPDETKDGVLGSLANGTSEIGIAALGISSTRMSSFGFIYSFFDRKYSILISQSHLISEEDRQWSATVSIINIVQPWVWILSLCLLILIAFLLTIARNNCSIASLINTFFRLLGLIFSESKSVLFTQMMS